MKKQSVLFFFVAFCLSISTAVKSQSDSILYTVRSVGTFSPDKNQISSWSLSPNPATTSLQLQLAAGHGAIVQAEVMDQGGRVLQVRSFSAHSLDISLLPAGFYTLRVLTADGKWGVKTFVKN